MAFSILIAFLNGLVVGTSRSINGRLSTEVGAFKASLWNHVVGFLFLSLALLVLGEWMFDASPAPPWAAYLGGIFGVLFVAVNSYVFPRLGAMNAMLLVISGQMISAVAIDALSRNETPTLTRWLGVATVILGVYLSRASSSARDKERTR